LGPTELKRIVEAYWYPNWPELADVWATAEKEWRLALPKEEWGGPYNPRTWVRPLHDFIFLLDHLFRLLERLESGRPQEYLEEFYTSQGSKGGPYTGDWNDEPRYIYHLFDDYEKTWLEDVEKICALYHENHKAWPLMVHNWRHFAYYAANRTYEYKKYGIVVSYDDHDVVERGVNEFGEEWIRFGKERYPKCCQCALKHLSRSSCSERYNNCASNWDIRLPIMRCWRELEGKPTIDWSKIPEKGPCGKTNWYYNYGENLGKQHRNKYEWAKFKKAFPIDTLHEERYEKEKS
jgi:hypothetical protein